MADKLTIDWKEYNLIVEKLAIQIHQSGYKPDILIHLAAVSHDGRSNQNPELAYQNSFRTLFNSL